VRPAHSPSGQQLASTDEREVIRARYVGTARRRQRCLGLAL